MNILRRLLDVHSLKRQVEALEASLRSKDELIRKLEEEKASINKRLENMIFRYRDVDSRLAAMNFRLFQLTQANKILTMKLTGTAAQRDALQRGLKKMKERGHGGDE
jgi:predicted  nucleic acid-binding Zn-ribbon protein